MEVITLLVTPCQTVYEDNDQYILFYCRTTRSDNLRFSGEKEAYTNYPYVREVFIHMCARYSSICARGFYLKIIRNSEDKK